MIRLYMDIIQCLQSRRMKATITQVESVVTPSGNSGHVVVPKAWIGRRSHSHSKKKED